MAFEDPKTKRMLISNVTEYRLKSGYFILRPAPKRDGYIPFYGHRKLQIYHTDPKKRLLILDPLKDTLIPSENILKPASPTDGSDPSPEGGLDGPPPD